MQNIEEELIESEDTNDKDSEIVLNVPALHSRCLLAIFSVVFDKNYGPLIEWSLPEGVELEGIEFSALASGLHETSGPDFVYFAKKQKKSLFYCMGVYRRHMLPNQSSRDAIMRSVGVCCEHYAFLYEHEQFLEQFTEKLAKPRLEEEEKDQLTKYFEQYSDKETVEPTSSPHLPSFLPSGAFNYLFSTFGAKMFTLWKAMLLGKRIMICSEPPTKILSLITYAATFLTRHSVKVPKWKQLNESNPLFHVNIATHSKFLQKQDHYIACTTERIFEKKPHFYEVFVDISEHQTQRRIITVKSVEITVYDGDKQALELNAGDISRFRFISQRFQAVDESRIIGFLQDLNNKLLHNMIQAKKKQKVIGPEHMSKFGLHKSDFVFFSAMVEHYDLNIELKKPVCTCCWC